MPYISQKDRTSLDVLIENLRARAVTLARSHRGMTKATWGYMRYIALRVLVATSLNAAEQYQGKRGIRYWLVVDQAGIASNIAFELFDRRVSSDVAERFDFRPLRPQQMPNVPSGAILLNPDIDALVREISRISSPDGYNYDGAYCGLVNYSMTELLPRILLSAKDANSVPLDIQDIIALIRFWLAIARELYVGIARQYEDEQIVKNGDVKIYHILLEHLQAAKGVKTFHKALL